LLNAKIILKSTISGGTSLQQEPCYLRRR